MRKSILIKLNLICYFILCVLPGTSQTIVDVINEKPGKLKKIIKSKNADTIVSLKLNGFINSDDLAYLHTLKSLQQLDLTNIVLTTKKEKIKNLIYEYPDHKSMCLPLFPNLKILSLPTECKELIIVYKEKNTPILSKLTMPSTCDITVVPQLAQNKLRIENLYIIDLKNNDLVNDKLSFDLITVNNPFARNMDSRFYGNFLDYKNNNNRITIDTLSLSNTTLIRNQTLTNFDPQFISIKSSNQLVLNKCKKNLKTINNVTYIMPGAFAKSNVNKVTIPKTVSAIPDYCFYNCKNLQSVIFEGSIRSIGQYAFANTGIKNITFPSSLQAVWLNAFDKCNMKLSAKIPPRIFASKGSTDKDKNEKLKNWTVEVPQVLYDRYQNNDMWNKTTLKALGAKNKYEITMETPGTIMSKIPRSAWNSVDTLIIKGFLYDTDMAIIRKMASLKYVDISNTYLSESPETKAENKRHEEELNAVAKLIGISGEMAYNDGKISTPTYLMAKGISALTVPASEIKEADENCIVPSDCFSGLRYLETVKMPLRAISIGHNAFSGCVNLRNVEFPLYVKTIGSEAFSDCANLRIYFMPKSITEIGSGAFKNCRSLHEVDLSKCKFTGTFSFGTIYGSNLQELKLPYGIETVYGSTASKLTVYFPTTVKKLDITFHDCKLHFSSKTPPITQIGQYSNKGSGNTIYVPKGSSTAYYNAFGNENNYVEE